MSDALSDFALRRMGERNVSQPRDHESHETIKDLLAEVARLRSTGWGPQCGGPNYCCGARDCPVCRCEDPDAGLMAEHTATLQRHAR